MKNTNPKVDEKKGIPRIFVKDDCALLAVCNFQVWFQRFQEVTI
jgi:hypothetical protein